MCFQSVFRSNMNHSASPCFAFRSNTKAGTSPPPPHPPSQIQYVILPWSSSILQVPARDRRPGNEDSCPDAVIVIGLLLHRLARDQAWIMSAGPSGGTKSGHNRMLVWIRPRAADKSLIQWRCAFFCLSVWPFPLRWRVVCVRTKRLIWLQEDKKVTDLSPSNPKRQSFYCWCGLNGFSFLFGAIL